MRRRDFLKTGVAAETARALAYAFEQATRHRRAPRFLRTAELVA